MKGVRHPEQQVVELFLDRVSHRQLALRGVRHLAQALLQRLVPRPRELLRELVLLGLDGLRLVQMSAPCAIEAQDVVDRRRLALELRGAADGIGILADELEREHYDSGFMIGKRITSRIDGWSVNSITRRSMPTPRPPHGGRPYSTARRQSSSIGCASTFPASPNAARAPHRHRWPTGSVFS